MSKENKKLSLMEALEDINAIMEAATQKAKDNMANELPEKFEELLSEQINKENESVKESKKDKTEEPVDEGKEKDTDEEKESLKEMEEIDMREMSMDEIEEAYNEAHPDDDFEVELSIDDIANEIGEMEEDNQTDEMEENVSDPYSKIKKLYEMMSEMMNEIEEEKKHEELKEKFHEGMSQMYGENYKDKIGEDKFSELYEVFKDSAMGESSEMNESEEMKEDYRDLTGRMRSGERSYVTHQAKQQQNQQGEKDKFAQKRAQAGGAATAEGEEMHEADDHMNEMDMNEAVSPELLQSAAGLLGVIAASGGIAALQNHLKSKNPKLAKMLDDLGTAASSSIRGGTTSMPNEGEEMHEADDHMNEEDHDDEKDRKDDEEVDEAHGVSYSAGKVRAGSLPNQGAEYRDRSGHSRNRGQWSNENYEKRMTSLIEENKKANKKLQESNETIEKYKGALEKYRGQLQEMAVVNTNIAHVNDFLIQESDLPSERVQEIINAFKDIDSITESEGTYKKMLSEMKEKKQTLDEGIEKKINNSVGESSQKLVEQAVEKTAFAGGSHLNEIKRRMDYIRSK